MSKLKYNEDKIIAELLEYIKGTYSEHYVGKENQIQIFDVYESLGSLDTTSRDTSIKYLMRYGKKAGYNKKDLLKTLHYTIILWYATQPESEHGSKPNDNSIDYVDTKKRYNWDV